MNSIGVVIPCKNYGHMIAEALRSITAQAGPVQTVIVDDGGNERAALDFIAKGFDSIGASVIHLPVSRGIGVARNTGVAYLNTDLILFLDADDWLHPGALEALQGMLSERPHAAFAYGNYTQQGELITTLNWSQGKALLNEQNIASYCNLWRRDWFWQIGGYSSAPVAEDWELQKRAARAGLIGAHSDFVIFEHRLHDKNKWSVDAARLGGLAGVARLLDDYAKQTN